MNAKQHHVQCAQFHTGMARIHKDAAASYDEDSKEYKFHTSSQHSHADQAEHHLTCCKDDGVPVVDTIHDRGDGNNLDGTSKVASGSPLERAESFDKAVPGNFHAVMPESHEQVLKNRLIDRSGKVINADNDPEAALDQQLAKLGK